jgi:O-antigen/teichoic acid export membrane protein
MGVMGMLTGNLIAAVIICLILMVACYKKICFCFDFNRLKPMLFYSFPMVISMFAAAGMHNIDRFFIKTYTSLAEVGLYSLAYQFPFMLNALFASSFDRIWGGHTLFMVEKEGDAAYQFKRIGLYYLSVAGYLLYCCSIGARSIVHIFLAPGYAQAATYIPLISLGIWLYSFHTFIRIGVVISRKTYLFTINYSLAFLINLLTNYILVPRFHATGAALATVITYGCFSFNGLWIYRKCYDLCFDWGRIFGFFLFAVILFWARSQILSQTLILDMMVDIGFALVLPVLIFYTPGALTGGEKSKLMGWLKSGFKS